jgi:thiamine-phosphate pyrophosphorylase
MTNPVADRRREWLAASRLYLVTDAKPHGDLEEFLRAALQGGVDVVQLREKSGDRAEIVRAGRVFRRLCDAYDALFIVNDDAELAIACAADGVHIGQDDARLGDVRRLVADDLLIGVSTHSEEQLAEACGADYVAVGPVFATPTKPAYRPVGTALVQHAAAHAPAPFFAIGGIDAGNVDEVVAAGAERVAVVRAIRDAPDPGAAARLLRERVENGAKARAKTGAKTGPTTGGKTRRKAGRVSVHRA